MASDTELSHEDALALVAENPCWRIVSEVGEPVRILVDGLPVASGASLAEAVQALTGHRCS